MPEVPGQPASPEEHRASFEDVLREEFRPENDLDQALLNTLAGEMWELVEQLNAAESVVGLISGYVTEALRRKEANIATKLMTEQDHVGLRRHSLIVVSLKNGAVERARHLMSLAGHNGDQKARRAYADTVVVLLNTIRFQLLHGVYNPSDEFWTHVEASIGRYQGDVVYLHLGPGIRERTVRRPEPPSDFLPPSPRVP